MRHNNKYLLIRIRLHDFLDRFSRFLGIVRHWKCRGQLWLEDFERLGSKGFELQNKKDVCLG
jgi:hypothetical protein